MMKKLLLVFILAAPVFAQQQPSVVTAADYKRAERFLSPNVAPLVLGGEVSATWLPDDRFWYRNVTAEGVEFVLIDPAKKLRAPYSPTPEDTAGRGAGSGRASRGDRPPDLVAPESRPLGVPEPFLRGRGRAARSRG